MDEDDEETSDSESTDSNNATSEATEEKSDAKSDSNKDCSDGIEERLSALEEKQASQNESDKETVQEETTPAADAEEEKAKATEDEDKSNENIQKTLIPDQYIEKEEVFGDDGKLSFTYQYEYDDEYRLIEKQCVYPDGTVNNDEKYTYDKDGNNIRIDHEDNKDSSYSYYTIHKYKGDDLIESTTYNVADDSVKYTTSYSYDDKNRLCQEKFENIEYVIKLPQIIFMMITAILYIAKGTMKDMKITRMMQMEILYRRRETMVQELSGNMKII